MYGLGTGRRMIIWGGGGASFVTYVAGKYGRPMSEGYWKNTTMAVIACGKCEWGIGVKE